MNWEFPLRLGPERQNCKVKGEGNASRLLTNFLHLFQLFLFFLLLMGEVNYYKRRGLRGSNWVTKPSGKRFPKENIF